MHAKNSHYSKLSSQTASQTASQTVILNAALLRTHLLRRMIQDLTHICHNKKKRKPEQIKLPFYHFTKNYLQITQKIMQQAKHIFSHYKVESTELK